MGIKQVLARNVAWNAAGLGAETVAAFVIMPVLINRLGETTYGVWIVLGALTSYFGLLDLGLRDSIGRQVALYHSKGNTAAVNQIVTGGLAVLSFIGLVVFTVVLAFEPLFFRLFDVAPAGRGDTSLALRIVTIQFVVYLLSTAFDIILWGLQRFDWINAVDIPIAILRVTLTLLLIKSEHDLVTLACTTLVLTAAGGSAKAVLCFRANAGLSIGRRHLKRRTVGELLRLGGLNLIANVARVTRRQLNPILIAALMGLGFVASYSVADRLLLLVTAAMGAVTGVFTPFATALHATDQTEKKRRLFLDGGKHASMLAVFLITFLLLLGSPLVNLWLGRTLANVTLLLAILATGELLPSTQQITNSILIASARYRALAALGLLEVCGTCLLAVALIPVAGLLGAGLAIAIPASVCRGVVPMVLGCRLVGVPIRRQIVEGLFPALLCGFVPMGIIGLIIAGYWPASWVLLVGYAIAYTVLFAAVYCCLPGAGRLRALYGRVVAMWNRYWPGRARLA